MNDRELLEKLSELEHIQWEQWSKTTFKKLEKSYENDGDADFMFWELRNRWEPNWKPYSEFDEKTKEFDREWARKVLEIIEEKL